VRDEREKVVAIYGAVAEAGSLLVPVRVEAAAADLHYLTVQALRSQGSGADLPSDRGGVFQRVVEAAREYVQAGVGSAGIRGTKRIELLDGTVSVHHDQRAGEETQSLYLAWLAEHELDELTEQANLRFLAWRRIPPVENGDQPARVAGARRRGTPVSVRQ
jgi:hypothetical protein